MDFYIVLIFVCHIGLVPDCKQVREPLIIQYANKRDCLEKALDIADDMEQVDSTVTLKSLPAKPWELRPGCWLAAPERVVMG